MSGEPAIAPADAKRRWRWIRTAAAVSAAACVMLAGVFAIWVIAIATHAGARYGGPVWLAIGLVLYVTVRKARGEGLLERVASADERHGLAEAEFTRILVPMKLGDIGEEMVATAVKLAQERGATKDPLIRDHIRTYFGFRYVETSDYATAMRVELAVKRGALGTPPRLNPQPPRPAGRLAARTRDRD